MEPVRFATHACIDNGCGIFDAPVEAHRRALFEPVANLLLPVHPAALVSFENVGILARIPVGAGMWRTIFFDEVGPLAEPPVVLAFVAAGFGDVVVERQKHFVADDFALVNLRFLHRATE